MKKQNNNLILVTPSSRAIYESILAEIMEVQNIGFGDKHLLMMYCNNLDIYNRMLGIINSDGGIQEFSNGTRQVSPEYTMMRNAQNDAQKISDKLVLNTAARARLKIPESVQITDPLNDVG
jgi:P27 family predicted phage terminase small subunit